MVRSGTKLVGSVVADSALRGLLKADKQQLESIEATVCKIMTTYSLKALPRAPLDLLLKARVQFCCKFGEALGGLTRGGDTVPEDVPRELDINAKLASAESRLRLLLENSGFSLPARVLGSIQVKCQNHCRRLCVVPEQSHLSFQVLSEKVDNKGSAKSRQAASSKAQADCLPALATCDGQVVRNAAADARRMGLTGGCSVLVGSEKMVAVFVQLSGEGAQVKFLDASGQEQVQDVPLADLEVLKPEDKKKVQAVKLVDTRQPGIEWHALTDVQVEQGIRDFVKSELLHLQGSLCPPKELLRYHREADGDHFSLNYAVKAGSLVFLPFTQALSEGQRGVKRRKSGKSQEGAEYPLLRVKKTDIKGAEPMYFTLEPSAGPFWQFFLEDGHQGQDVPNLTYRIMKTQATQSGSAQFSIQGKMIKKTSKMSLELCFPVLTNLEDLPAYTILRACCAGPPNVKDA